MVACGREEPHAVVDRPTFWILGAVIEPANARKRDRCRAHRAGLQRHVEVGTGKPLLPKCCAGHADRGDFGMGSDIVEFAGAIACLDHVAHDHGAYLVRRNIRVSEGRTNHSSAQIDGGHIF
jgi:hypothetical protein